MQQNDTRKRVFYIKVKQSQRGGGSEEQGWQGLPAGCVVGVVG